MRLLKYLFVLIISLLISGLIYTGFEYIFENYKNQLVSWGIISIALIAPYYVGGLELNNGNIIFQIIGIIFRLLTSILVISLWFFLQNEQIDILANIMLCCIAHHVITWTFSVIQYFFHDKVK